MPCHAIPSFLPPPLHVPQPETTCRRGKEEIRRHQCRRRRRRRQEEHMDRAPSIFMRRPALLRRRAWHVPAAKAPSDDTRRSSFAQRRAKRENSARSKQTYIQAGQRPPPSPPPPVSCGRRNQLALCNRTFTPPPRYPAPHTPPHTEILIRPSPCRSSRPLFARSWPAFRAGLGIAQEGRVRDFHTYQGGQEGRRTETRARRPTVLDVFYSGDCTAAGRRKEQSSAFTFTRDIP